MRTDGVIVDVAPGVYKIVGSSSCYEQRVHAAVLDAGAGVASYFSAARLWNLYNTNKVEITVPARANARIANAIVHRSASIERTDVVDFIPVSNPARTIIDIAPQLTASALDMVLQRVLNQNLATFASIRNEIELLRTPARKGITIVERRLETFDPRDAASNLAREALTEIRRRGLPEPAKELHLVVEGVNRYIDYAYPEFRLAIEVDSRNYHTRLLDFDNDRTRNSGISALGWHLLSITRRNMAQDIDRIERFIRRLNAA